VEGLHTEAVIMVMIVGKALHKRINAIMANSYTRKTISLSTTSWGQIFLGERHHKIVFGEIKDICRNTE